MSGDLRKSGVEASGPMACELRTRMPVTPTGLEQMRFDYAWNWFNFHAEQRTKMFNYMLIGMGIFATAFVTAVDKKLALEAAVLSSAAAFVALVFFLIDQRNRELYIAAMDVLIDAEKEVVFGDTTFENHRGAKKTFGVSRRIAVDDGPEAKTLADHLRGMAKGQHRYWMPLIALGFMALFALGAMRAWLIYAGAVPRWPVTAAGVLVLLAGAAALLRHKHEPWWYACVASGVLAIAVAQMPGFSVPLKATGDLEVLVGGDLNSMLDLRFRQPLEAARGTEMGLLASARFGPFATGDDTIDCRRAEHVHAVADIRSALEDAQGRQQRVLLLLVGGTDRTPLTPALRQRFGSDAGLARARVSAAEGCLSAQGSTPLVPDVLRLISGPAYTPASPAASDASHQAMADDRVVRVVVVGLQTGR